MVKKKPNLKKALKKIENAPKGIFGNLDIDLSTLPCFTKPKKEKITANFDSDLLEEIRNFAEINDISYTVVMNDVLRKVFIENKKAS
jgi:hypothetical protein